MQPGGGELIKLSNERHQGDAAPPPPPPPIGPSFNDFNFDIKARFESLSRLLLPLDVPRATRSCNVNIFHISRDRKNAGNDHLVEVGNSIVDNWSKKGNCSHRIFSPCFSSRSVFEINVEKAKLGTLNEI